VNAAHKLLWAAAAAGALAIAFGTGFVVARAADSERNAALADRLEGYNSCLLSAMRTPQYSRDAPRAYYAVVDAFLMTSDCARHQGLPFYDRRDIYEISGVRWKFDMPPSTDPIWLHPDLPRKALPADFLSGLKPPGTWRHWMDP
jgi:hypothetical protein